MRRSETETQDKLLARYKAAEKALVDAMAALGADPMYGKDNNEWLLRRLERLSEGVWRSLGECDD